jgi:hypothetical protein
MVYSLGVGDQIIYYWSFGDMRGSSTSVIRGLNANTFLIVNSIGRNEYVAKNSSIAYDALKTAPSPYCYQ